MNPLRFVARSRLRLGVTALLGYALFFAAAGPLTEHVRQVSTSAIGDLALITGWLAWLLPGSLALGVLIGDFVFPGRWRERVILGLADQPGEGGPESLLISVESFKSYMGHFSVLVALQLLLAGWTVGVLTNDFFGEYGRIGYARTTLRGGDEGAKLAVVESLGDAAHPQQIRDAVALVDMAWRDSRQPISVRRAAVRTLGRLSRSLVRAIEAWLESEGVTETWEREELRELRRQVAPELTAVLDDGPVELQAAVALALGQLRDPTGLPALVDFVRGRAAGGSEAWRAAVVALGLARDASVALGPLVDLATATASRPADFEVLGWATGELARHYVPGTERQVDAIFGRLVTTFGALLDGARPVEVRCAAAAVLAMTGDTAIADPLFAAFDADGATDTCPPLELDLGQRTTELVRGEQKLRLLILQALGLIAVGNERVLDWVRERRDGPQYSDYIRGQLAHVLELVEASEESGTR